MLQIGHIYDHPTEGPIKILSGAHEVMGRVSNHWHWLALDTGIKGNGYGGPWKDISDQYVILHVRVKP